MKSTIFSVLVGLLLVAFILPLNDALIFDSIAQNEINRLFHAQEPMDGNITLTSNSTLGLGGYAFILAGKTNDGTAVAVKATPIKELSFYTREYECYKQLNATMDKVCEKYGIPFIYHSGDFLNYKTMAMTKLDIDLDSLDSKIDGFSLDSILIIFRDMIKTFKFTHSKGIAQYDIKSDNIMTKGANVFLIDLNWCAVQQPSNRTYSFIYIDMLRFLRTMSDLFKIPKYCKVENILENYDEINEKKREMKQEFLRQNIKYTELVEPFVEYCFEVAEAQHNERIPKYDYLYKIFDDLLYTGRIRSERIVFEWLTPEERAIAMAESVLPIESIVFSENNIH